MARRQPLPAELPPTFLVGDALAAGVGRGRLRGRDLGRPFHGVRVAGSADGLVARCRALLCRTSPGVLISHSTAALLLGVPLPLSLELDAVIHLSTIDPDRPPQISGAVSHQISLRGGSIRRIAGIPMTSPALTWCLLAPMLSVPDLVAAGDFLVSGQRPWATLAQLAAAARASRGQRGAAKLTNALPQVRVGPRSSPESHGRLLYVAAGIPEPELNGPIYRDDGTFVAMSDLVWRAKRVANEYEGKHHQERGQFRADILRRERVEDTGWRLSRFTGDDLYLRPAETVLRMADRLQLAPTPQRVAAAVAQAAEIGL